MLWILLSLLLPTAQADSFRLANGSTIEGTLATYELSGNCQIFVASGPVRGATLLLPCTEILAFSRVGPAEAAPAPAGAALAVEEVAAPAAIVMPVPVQAPVEPPVEAAPPAAPAADEPVSASLPAGMTLPGDDGISEAGPATAQASNLRGTPRPVERLDGGTEADPAPAAKAADAPSASDVAGAPDGSTPQGWRTKESAGMPRWLHRTIYGDPPPTPPSEEQGS